MSESASYTLTNCEIFAAGRQRGKDYSSEDLEQICSNFEKFSGPDAPKVYLRVPAVIGHEEDQEYLNNTGLPAAGWVTALRTDGEKLLADFDDVPEVFAKLLRGKSYSSVSAEIYDTPPDGIPAPPGTKMLRRVAFLGAEVPQVKGLADIPTPEKHSEGAAVQRFRRAGVSYRGRVKLPGGCYAAFSEVAAMAEPRRPRVGATARVSRPGHQTHGMTGAVARASGGTSDLDVEGLEGNYLSPGHEGRVFAQDRHLTDDSGQGYGAQAPADRRGPPKGEMAEGGDRTPKAGDRVEVPHRGYPQAGRQTQSATVTDANDTRAMVRLDHDPKAHGHHADLGDMMLRDLPNGQLRHHGAEKNAERRPQVGQRVAVDARPGHPLGQPNEGEVAAVVEPGPNQGEAGHAFVPGSGYVREDLARADTGKRFGVYAEGDEVEADRDGKRHRGRVTFSGPYWARVAYGDGTTGFHKHGELSYAENTARGEAPLEPPDRPDAAIGPGVERGPARAKTGDDRVQATLDELEYGPSRHRQYNVPGPAPMAEGENDDSEPDGTPEPRTPRGGDRVLTGEGRRGLVQSASAYRSSDGHGRASGLAHDDDPPNSPSPVHDNTSLRDQKNHRAYDHAERRPEMRQRVTDGQVTGRVVGRSSGTQGRAVSVRDKAGAETQHPEAAVRGDKGKRFGTYDEGDMRTYDEGAPPDLGPQDQGATRHDEEGDMPQTMREDCCAKLAEHGMDDEVMGQMPDEHLQHVLEMLDRAKNGDPDDPDADDPDADPDDPDAGPDAPDEPKWPKKAEEPEGGPGDEQFDEADDLKDLAGEGAGGPGDEDEDDEEDDPNAVRDDQGKKDTAMKMSDRGKKRAAVKMSELSSLITRVCQRVIRRELPRALTRDARESVAVVRKFNEEAVSASREAAVNAVIDELDRAGKLPPAEREAERRGLMLADARQAHKFSENGKTFSASAYELRVRQLRGRPSKFGERIASGRRGGARSEDGEAEQIREAFAAFSERWINNGMTEDRLVAGFKAEKSRNPKLTADEYLNR